MATPVEIQQELERVRAEEQNDDQQAEKEEVEATPAVSQNSGVKEMSTFFFVCWLIAFLIIDLIEIFTAGTIGWIVGILGNILFFLIVRQKKLGKDKIQKILVGLIGDSIPFLDILPLRTLSLIWAHLS